MKISKNIENAAKKTRRNKKDVLGNLRGALGIADEQIPKMPAKLKRKINVRLDVLQRKLYPKKSS